MLNTSSTSVGEILCRRNITPFIKVVRGAEVLSAKHVLLIPNIAIVKVKHFNRSKAGAVKVYSAFEESKVMIGCRDLGK